MNNVFDRFWKWLNESEPRYWYGNCENCGRFFSTYYSCKRRLCDLGCIENSLFKLEGEFNDQLQSLGVKRK